MVNLILSIFDMNLAIPISTWIWLTLIVGAFFVCLFVTEKYRKSDKLHQGFMYKTSFYFEYQGHVRKPKFHICKCQAIDSFGKDTYRFANAEPI